MKPIGALMKLPALACSLPSRFTVLEATVLTPTVLVAIPGFLLAWSLVELLVWRLLCQPKRGQVGHAWACLSTRDTSPFAACLTSAVVTLYRRPC